MINYIGYLAIIVGAVSLSPQILQMYKTKKVEDINIFFLIIAIISDILYFIYSIYTNDIVFIISIIPPSISHILMTILWFKYRYKNKMIMDISHNNIDQNDILI
jgi:uncharacterized protein with PQ loop repeat